MDYPCIIHTTPTWLFLRFGMPFPILPSQIAGQPAKFDDRVMAITHRDVEAKENKEAVMLELEQLANYKAELHQSCDFVVGVRGPITGNLFAITILGEPRLASSPGSLCESRLAL